MRMKRKHFRHGTFAGMMADGCILGISIEISDACVVEHAVIMSGMIHRIPITSTSSLSTSTMPTLCN
eukprot:14717480-Heterocapsa_arctica.AAC.1